MYLTEFHWIRIFNDMKFDVYHKLIRHINLDLAKHATRSMKFNALVIALFSDSHTRIIVTPHWPRIMDKKMWDRMYEPFTRRQHNTYNMKLSSNVVIRNDFKPEMYKINVWLYIPPTTKSNKIVLHHYIFHSLVTYWKQVLKSFWR